MIGKSCHKVITLCVNSSGAAENENYYLHLSYLPQEQGS